MSSSLVCDHETFVGAPRRSQSRTSSGWNLLPLTPKRCERSSPRQYARRTVSSWQPMKLATSNAVQQPVGQALPFLRLAAADELIVDPNRSRIRVQIPHGRLRDFALIGIGWRGPARMPNSQCGRRPVQGGRRCEWRTSREAPRVSDGRDVDHWSGGRLEGPEAGRA